MPRTPRRTGGSSKSRLGAALLLRGGVHGVHSRGHQTRMHTKRIYEFLRKYTSLKHTVGVNNLVIWRNIFGNGLQL